MWLELLLPIPIQKLQELKYAFFFNLMRQLIHKTGLKQRLQGRHQGAKHHTHTHVQSYLVSTDVQK